MDGDIKLNKALLFLGILGCIIALAPSDAFAKKTTLASLNMRPLWTHTLAGPKRAKGYRVETSAPLVRDDRIYIGNLSGQVMAIDRASGKRLWKRETGAPIEGDILFDNETLYVGNNDGQLMALAPNDGSLVWEFRIAEELLSRPVVVGTELYVLTAADRLLRIDRTGALLGSVSLARSSPELSLRGQGNPERVGSLVVIPLTEGAVVAYDTLTHAVLWRQQLQSADARFLDSDSAPLIVSDALDGQRVFVSVYRNGVYCLDAKSGAVLWQDDGDSASDLAIEATTLYVATSTGQLLAMDSATGRLVWKREIASDAKLTNPVIIGDRVVVGEYSRGLIALDRVTGTPIGRQAVPGGISAPLVGDGGVYFLSNHHKVYAYTMKD